MTPLCKMAHRLTITLDEEVYAMARSHAIATKTSLSKAIADLMRQRRSSPAYSAEPGSCRHPVSGFPVSCGDGRTLSNLEVARGGDEDLICPMESLGLSTAEIEKALK